MRPANELTVTLLATDEDDLRPVAPLLDHLNAQVHELRVAHPDDEAAGSDVLHAFGWDAALTTDRARPEVPWVLTPPPLVTGRGLPAHDDEVAALRRAAGVLARSSRHNDELHRIGVPWYRLGTVSPSVDHAAYARLGPSAPRTELLRVVAEPTPDSAEAEQLLGALRLVEAAELVVFADDAERDRVRHLAECDGVADRVAVVNPAEPAERAWWMRSADVGAAVPTAPVDAPFVLQAMACGTALVATPVDELEDALVHGVTGLHVPPGDTVSLARALRSVLDDEFTAEAYGMAGSDRAINRFSPERVARDLAAVYARVALDPPEPDDDVDDEDEDVPVVV